MTDEVLTAKQLAERWSIRIQTLANWRAQECGPVYFNVGRSIRYRMKDVLQYENEGMKK